MTQPLPGDIFDVGDVLNNTYEIDRILGRGGTGEVYRARNRITERLVAIKALNRQFSGNADYIELMKREEEMRAIQHDAVVRYTECSLSDDGHVFLVMDYVEGSPLSDVMMRRRMEPRELLIIGHRVAEGLVATHAKGSIHRDLSPDNIILRHGDPTKATIIDFGIAKDTAVGARTIVGSEFAGKYEYSAPEQLDGQVTPQSDLYALGATLLAAWRGETPFTGATPGEIIRRKQKPLDTEGVPDMLRGVVEALTAPNPTNRPTDADAALDMIDAVLRPGQDTHNNIRKERSPSKAWPFATVGAACLGLGAAWYFGVFDGLRRQPLPVAEPFTLELTAADGSTPPLTGHAPDPETAELLRSAITAGFGQPPTGEIIIATGVPDEAWDDEVGVLMEQTAALETTQLSVADRSAILSGLAADIATRTAVIDAVDAFAAAYDWRISVNLKAGPLVLPTDALRTTLSEVEDCGPLIIEGATDGQFGLTDRITITGNLSEAETRDIITDKLEPLVGDRPVSLATQTLNPAICTIRRVLAEVPQLDVPLALTDGQSGARNLSGVFTVGQNPVVDLLIAQEYGSLSLQIFAINNDESVINIVPNQANQNAQIDRLAGAQDGFYRVRVLHTLAENAADRSKLAAEITNDALGKIEIIAVFSHEPLFEIVRPSRESVAAMAEALQTILAQDFDNIIGFSSAIIDARP